MAFNGLTDAEAERLGILAEECAEVIQAVGKILRHGYETGHPTKPEGLTNRQQLELELGDVGFILGFMVHEGDVREQRIALRRTEKASKIQHYLHHNQVPS